MSYADLASRADKADLMSKALTYQRGKDEGVYLMQINPEFKKMAKERQKKLEIK
jgi:hypothetical protein